MGQFTRLTIYERLSDNKDLQHQYPAAALCVLAQSLMGKLIGLTMSLVTVLKVFAGVPEVCR